MNRSKEAGATAEQVIAEMRRAALGASQRLWAQYRKEEPLAVPQWRGIVVGSLLGVSAENGVGMMLGPKEEQFSQLQTFVLLQELNA